MTNYALHNFGCGMSQNHGPIVPEVIALPFAFLEDRLEDSSSPYMYVESNGLVHLVQSRK